jgi:hypothetical protein
MLLSPARLPAVMTMLLGISGCVVPAGPEWTDPQTNFPPTIVYSKTTPPVGSVLAVDPDAGALLVEAVLADENTQDNLYVRWIIDYPPYQAGISHVALEQLLPGGNQTIHFAPGCNANDNAISRNFSNHRLLLAVSDRPFANPDSSRPPFDSVSSGNFLVEGSWQFELDCSQ